VAEACGAADVECSALRTAGYASLASATGQGEELLRSALLLARRTGNLAEEGLTLGGLAHCDLTRGRFEAATARWREALALHERCGARRLAAVSRMELGVIQLRTHDHAGAVETFDEALAEFRAVGDVLGQALCHGNRANSLRWLGRMQEAIEAGRTAVALVPAEMPRRAAQARIQLALALDSAGDPQGADVEGFQALELAERADDPKLTGEILMVLAWGARAVPMLRRAIELFASADRTRLAEALARLALAEPDLRAAAAALEESRAVAATVQATPILLQKIQQATQRLNGAGAPIGTENA
jgi:tetratricopeptide (TPR) repeat protein